MTAEITWGDVPICSNYGCFVEYGTVSNDPPSPKTSIVSIPGGDDLDLTDAITGFAAFEDREVSFGLYYDGRGDMSWHEMASAVANLMDGMRSEFALSWDEGYTYVGRAAVSGVEFLPPNSCRLTVTIDASPWRLKERHKVTVSAVGGRTVTCKSGRRPVHPSVSCDYPAIVNWRGAQFVVPAGDAYVMSQVTFTQGDNELWVSAYQPRTARWDDLSSRTWSSLSSVTWGSVTVGDPDPDGFIGSANVTLSWEEAYL